MARKPVSAPSARSSKPTPHLEGLSPAPKPDWSRRWMMIRAVLFFCAALSLYIAVFGADDRLRESAFLGLLALAGSVVLGYLGFATQDDRNWLQSVGDARAQREARR